VSNGEKPDRAAGKFEHVINLKAAKGLASPSQSHALRANRRNGRDRRANKQHVLLMDRRGRLFRSP
jgi:hypothetical protein